MLGGRRIASLLALAGASTLPLASAWYLPGSSPRSYGEGDTVPFLVNVVQAKANDNTGTRGLLSYDYYDPRFHFCQPRAGPQAVSEGLGSALFGDRIYTTPLGVRAASASDCLGSTEFL